ncbi:iron-containing alcohol dehydrogenase [Clostridiaceae bacterium 35-E11]
MKELKFHGESIVTGQGALNYLENIKGKKVFIVTGSRSMFQNGTMDKIEEILGKGNTIFECYSGIPANPTTKDILDGLEKMRAFEPDVLIGLGGGSAIDASKVMGLFYEYPEYNFQRVLKEPLPGKREKLQFIAIPSTSGTATEVTRAAVVTFEDRNLKIGLMSDAFIADVAILDANITLSMPPHIVAETGMDAMTHAVECYINKRVDDFTACLAKGAVEGLFAYLPQSFEKGDVRSREKVHNYQCMAGSAFSNVGLGMAHGISHAFGGMFNLGHGLLNAIALPYVLEYNTRDEEVAQKLTNLARIIQEEDFIQGIRKLNEKLRIPISFKEAGIEKKDFEDKFEELLKNSLKGSTRSNPVKMTEEAMEKILWTIYEGK